jgi:hypothetical protein
MNTVDISEKSKELLMKGDYFEDHLEKMSKEFDQRNFIEILKNTNQIDNTIV